MRLGVGPVFEFESLVTARRAQTYAVRAGALALLLAGLCVVQWFNEGGRPVTVVGQARLGSTFFYAIVGTQLAFALLVAPAATAGAICLDKARGTLTHVLVTDLTAAEIVLGKLAARSMPVLGSAAAVIPVVFTTAFLGGIDPDALLGAFAITVAVTLFSAALALLFSIHAGRTHEALLATYLVICIWLLAEPLTRQIGRLWIGFPAWPDTADPFLLAFATYRRPGSVDWSDYALFVAVVIGLAAVLAVLSVFALRPACLATKSQRLTPRPARRSIRLPIPGPRLDPNPILWREWHRNQPSRWTSMVWAIYAVGAVGFTGTVVYIAATEGAVRARFLAAWVNGLQVAVGLLLLSVSAATSLAEERARGSLDVVLTTPMSTAAIVWGKWWGSFRRCIPVLILPTTIAMAMALDGGHTPSALWLIAYVTSAAALVNSLGLLCAALVPRLGRAVGLTVALYVVGTVGWCFLCLATFRGIEGEQVGMGSPFMGAAGLAWRAGHDPAAGPDPNYGYWGVVWTLFHAMAAIGMLVVTLLIFNKCLGRMAESPTTSPFRNVGRRAVPLGEPVA